MTAWHLDCPAQLLSQFIYFGHGPRVYFHALVNDNLKMNKAHLTICTGANRGEGLVPIRHLPHRFVQLQLVKSLRRRGHGGDDQVS